MQTFVPLDQSFKANARVLDRDRLWKQAVEARQIMDALLKIDEEARHPGAWPKIGWKEHPAVKMWQGHERALGRYMRAMLGASLARGVKVTENTQDQFFGKARTLAERFPRKTDELPDWWGGDIHFTHRVSLCRKDWDHYGGLFPDVMDTDCVPPEDGGVGYHWPKPKPNVSLLDYFWRPNP